MSRVEKFRQANRLRKKYYFSIILSVFILIGGISSADLAIANLLENKNSFEFISYRKLNNSILEINFLNEKCYLNSVYIYRDYQKIKKRIQSIIN